MYGIIDANRNATADELHRRRVMAGSKAPLGQAVAETSLLLYYGRSLQMEDLAGPRLELKGIDLADQSFRVVSYHCFPIGVYDRFLDVDIIVFAKMTATEGTVLGWLRRVEVEEAPVTWFEKNGIRRGYSHMVRSEFLSDMPKEFRFVDPCAHGELYGAIWNDKLLGWECCGCDRYLYDQRTREHIFNYHNRQSGHTMSEGETG